MGLATSQLPAGILKWIKITKSYTDFATNGLTNTISILSPLPRTTIHIVSLKPVVEFSGGSILAYTISCGYGLGLNALLADCDVTTIPINYFISNFSPVTILSGSDDVTLTATSIGANLDEAVQGEVDVWLLVGQLP